MGKDNKVKYGLKNVHYAPITEDETGALTFETPIPYPGAVSLTLDAQGDPLEFYADDGVYYDEDTNDGYDCELETALIPDQFRQDCLGDELVDGVLYENANPKQKGKKFALLYEFKGDKKATRHVLYYCSASRPGDEASTQSDSKEVQTSTLNFRSRPHPVTEDVKAKTTIDATNYETWYDSVPEKPIVPEA